MWACHFNYSCNFVIALRGLCVCVKPVITYGYFTISYNEARKTICGDNKNWILIQTCRGLECESEVSSQRRRFWCHSDINLGRWVDVPAMLVRTFAQAVLLPCFWVLWQESIARISPFATVPHRRWLRKSGDGKFYSHHHQINLSSVFGWTHWLVSTVDLLRAGLDLVTGRSGG